MFVLASGSPRRRELLTQIGLTFDVEVADIDETPQVAEAPDAYVKRLAEHKASVVFARHRSPARLVVLGADTTVVCDGPGGGVILGKPEDAADAARMLRMLSGKTHRVMTGVALVSATSRQVAVEVTEVEMVELSDRQIADYVASGEAMGKAGAYGIQGRAARFIPRINGCYFNVVGLPLARVSGMLETVR